MSVRTFIRTLMIVGIGILCLGMVVKKKSPLQLTQTDPIGYEQKAKEEAEGKKGPPAPTLELVPRQRFLSEGPVDKALEPEEGEEFKLSYETDDTWEGFEGEEWPEFEEEEG